MTKKTFDANLNEPQTKTWLEKGKVIGVAAVCLLIVTFLQLTHRSKTKVLLELKADAVSMRLAVPLKLSNGILIKPPLQINGLNQLDFQLYENPLQSVDGEVWLQFDQGRITLSELTLEKGGFIELDTKPDPNYFSLKGSLSGELLIDGHIRFQTYRHWDETETPVEKTLRGPESLAFTAKDQGAVPTILALNTYNPFEHYNIAVNKLSFFREVKKHHTESQFVSTILSGSINLPEVKERIDLYPGEPLKLKGLSGRLTRLTIGKQISIQFEGNVKDIGVGSQGFERKLAPSWLKYLYNQQTLYLIWGAFIFIWGILWNIHKMWSA